LDWGWGIVVSVMRKAVAVNAAVQTDDLGPASAYILDLLLSCDAASVKGQYKIHCGLLHVVWWHFVFHLPLSLPAMQSTTHACQIWLGKSHLFASGKAMLLSK